MNNSALRSSSGGLRQVFEGSGGMEDWVDDIGDTLVSSSICAGASMLNSLVRSVEVGDSRFCAYFCCSAMKVRTFWSAASRSPFSESAPPTLRDDVDAKLFVLSNFTNLKSNVNKTLNYQFYIAVNSN